MTLSTTRLTIRQIKEDDFPSMIQLLQEKKIRSFIHLPNTLPKFKIYAKSYQEKRRKGKTIRWVVILSQTKKVIWSIVLKQISQKHKKANIWYRLGENYEWNGFMTEALQATLHYIFNTMKLHRIQAWIRTDNISSIHLAEKLWFVREGIARRLHFSAKEQVYHDFFLYGMLVEDFLTKQKKSI